MTQFNQIYINNIVDGLNNTVIDATSITPAEASAGDRNIKQTLPSLLKNQNPYFILNGPCEWFESWSDSRINFSCQTVDFFLYEVLYVWNNNKRWDCPDGVIVEDCVINEFDMIDRWCKKHNCKYRIFVNEYNMLKSLQDTKYAKRAIHHLDTFSLAYYEPKFKNEDSYNLEYEILYKLNCFTYRWDQHRMFASAWLAGRQDCIVTHYHKTADVKYKWPIKNSIYYKDLINKKNALQYISPLSLEKHLTEKFDPRTNILPVTREHLTTDSIEYYYFRSFASLVCETNYEYPWGQLSEKTINPLRFENAIILLAGPGSLAQARSWGFITFSQWWDESYDTIINPCERMDAVLKVVDTILNYSFEELVEIKKQMAPILLHNRNIIRTGEFRKNIMKEIL